LTTTTDTSETTTPPSDPETPPPDRPNRAPPKAPSTRGPPRTPDRDPEDTQQSQQSQGGGGEFGFLFGSGGAAQAGWFNETVAAFAGADRSAAASVDEQAEDSLADFGTFSVASEGSEEFEAAAAFFAGEGVGVEGFQGGDDGLL
jgi:hypothetical protein